MIRQKTLRGKRSSRYHGKRLDITASCQTWALHFVLRRRVRKAADSHLTVRHCHTHKSFSVETRASYAASQVVEHWTASPGAPHAGGLSKRQRTRVWRPAARPPDLLQTDRSEVFQDRYAANNRYIEAFRARLRGNCSTLPDSYLRLASRTPSRKEHKPGKITPGTPELRR